jgi:1-acyl-sn-glycerol-3-phosphate acyltransferase
LIHFLLSQKNYFFSFIFFLLFIFIFLFRRSIQRYVLPLLNRLILFFCFGYYYIKTKGTPDPNVRVIIGNHTSMVDQFFFSVYFGCLFVAKAEVKNMALLGSSAQAIQCIFVDRAAKDSRKATLEEIVRKSKNDLFPPVGIFPEGTTTNGKCLICNFILILIFLFLLFL